MGRPSEDDSSLRKMAGRMVGSYLGHDSMAKTVMADRFRHLFKAHGVQPQQIQRLIPEVTASRAAEREALHKVLTDDVLQRTAHLFGIERGWLDGMDMPMYRYRGCNHWPKHFFREFEDLHPPEDGRPLRAYCLDPHLDYRSGSHQPVVITLVDHLARWDNDEELVRFKPLTEPWDWRDSTSRHELKALLRTAREHLGVQEIRLFVVDETTLSDLAEGKIVPPKVRYSHDVCLEDYIMTNRESMVAKESDEVPTIRSYGEGRGFATMALAAVTKNPVLAEALPSARRIYKSEATAAGISPAPKSNLQQHPLPLKESQRMEKRSYKEIIGVSMVTAGMVAAAPAGGIAVLGAFCLAALPMLLDRRREDGAGITAADLQAEFIAFRDEVAADQRIAEEDRNSLHGLLSQWAEVSEGLRAEIQTLQEISIGQDLEIARLKLSVGELYRATSVIESRLAGQPKYEELHETLGQRSLVVMICASSRLEINDLLSARLDTDELERLADRLSAKSPRYAHKELEGGTHSGRVRSLVRKATNAKELHLLVEELPKIDRPDLFKEITGLTPNP